MENLAQRLVLLGVCTAHHGDVLVSVHDALPLAHCGTRRDSLLHQAEQAVARQNISVNPQLLIQLLLLL